jgi:uncharacterized protein (TIGR02147 family)
MRKKQKILVYDYLNYRQYLKDYYTERKRLNEHFSYRYFASIAGYNSSSLLKRVTDGQLNIEKEVIKKISTAIGHNRKEAVFFANLVHFNQATTVAEKTKNFEQLINVLRNKENQVSVGQYDYFSKWYIPAIRDLLSYYNFSNDYKDLAKHLRPKITEKQAKSAINVLLKHGFIKKNYNGFFKAVDQIITTDSELKSSIIANYQKTLMDLAKEAIDRFPPQERDISSISFSIARKDLLEIKNEIEFFRTKIKNIILNSKDEEILYNMNLQIFPLSKNRH